jgi:hypothetical protein
MTFGHKKLVRGISKITDFSNTTLSQLISFCPFCSFHEENIETAMKTERMRNIDAWKAKQNVIEALYRQLPQEEMRQIMEKNHGLIAT